MRRKNKISISILSLNGGGVKIVINLFFVDSGKVLSTLLNLISLPSVLDLFIRKVLKPWCEYVFYETLPDPRIEFQNISKNNKNLVWNPLENMTLNQLFN